MTTARPTPRQAWLLAVRPKTLPAAITPVIVGTALAVSDRAFATIPALACIAVALLLQIAANFANDLFDFRRGADTAERLGPTRVTQSGLLTPEQVRSGTIVVVALAAVDGLYLVWRGGWPLLVLGAAAILAALAYTGGPFPFGYYGLGEVVCVIFFGFVAVAGTYYVQALRVTGLALAAAVPIGALVTAILVVNNLRDLETDRKAGKYTLAVRIGRSATQFEYALLVAIAYSTLPILWLIGTLSPWVHLPLLTLPLGIRLIGQTRRETGRALNATLAGTAQLELLFGLLFAAGIVASRLLETT